MAFFGLFGKKPKSPKIEAARGHRGIAAGSLAERQRRQNAGEQPYSPEEVEAWETLSVNAVDQFVNHGVPLDVHSSNVASFTYYIEENKLLVTFLSGGRYLYENVLPNEALAIAQAPSKGAACWDYLRVRGSSHGHRKPFSRLN